MGRKEGLSLRALAVGLLGVVACTYIVAHAELVLPATYMGAAHLPGASLGVLLFLVPANWLVRRATKGRGLSAGEIVLAYYMMTAASLIASFGLANHLLPGIIGLNYLADITARWEALSKNLKPWMVPFDLRGGPNQLVSRRFYEGLRAGEHVPLGDWLVPLLFWSAFFLLLTFALFCIATILRKQWVEHERVSFPLVQLPVEIAGAEPVRGSFFGNWLTWAGFSVPFLFHAVNGLHALYPVVPQFKVWIPLNQYFPPGRPFDGLHWFPLVITFAPIGFAYFVPLDVLFSMWFFFLFSRFEGLLASLFAGSALLVPKVGHPGWVFVAYQSVGAFVVIAAYMIWAARGHIRAVLRAALGFVKGIDKDEPMPYRAAVFGLLLSFGLLLLWAHFAGLSLSLAAGLLFVLLFLLEPVLARCVAEGGLIMIQALFLPLDIPAMFVPRTALGARNLVPLGIIDSVFARDRRGSLLPTMFDAFKACDMVGVRRRAMFVALAMAIPVAMLSSFLIELWLCYHKGALNLRGAFTVSLPFSMTRPYLQMLGAPPQPPGWQPPVFTAVGAAVTVLLYAMRARFPWWPFHPLGYAMGATWSLFPLWFAFMVGWLLKASILRYGGRPMFVKARPLFLGLIMGEYAAALVWVVVSCFTGKPGPSILQW